MEDEIGGLSISKKYIPTIGWNRQQANEYEG